MATESGKAKPSASAGVTGRHFLVNEEVRGRVISEIMRLDLSEGFVVSISKPKDKRSLAQNALYWAWIHAISDLTGYETEELHNRFRSAFLAPIFLEDPKNTKQELWCEGYAKVASIVGDDEEATEALKMVRGYVSTTWCTVKQFTEYLERIEHFCRAKGIVLPIPEEYWVALGR